MTKRLSVVGYHLLYTFHTSDNQKVQISKLFLRPLSFSHEFYKPSSFLRSGQNFLFRLSKRIRIVENCAKYDQKNQSDHRTKNFWQIFAHGFPALKSSGGYIFVLLF